MPYTMIRNGDRMNGGIRPQGDQEKQMGVPPNWLPYFTERRHRPAASPRSASSAAT